MNDKIVTDIVKKFTNQGLVLGNFILNYVLRQHPELADSEEVCKLRTQLRELKELEKEL